MHSLFMLFTSLPPWLSLCVRCLCVVSPADTSPEYYALVVEFFGSHAKHFATTLSGIAIPPWSVMKGKWLMVYIICIEARPPQLAVHFQEVCHRPLQMTCRSYQHEMQMSSLTWFSSHNVTTKTAVRIRRHSGPIHC